MKRILEKIDQIKQHSNHILCDNSSTIKLSKNPVFYGRSIHIDVRNHFLRDMSKAGIVNLIFCGTKDQLADLFSKSLKIDTFERFRRQLEVMEMPKNKLTVYSFHPQLV